MREEILGVIETLDELIDQAVDMGDKRSIGGYLEDAIISLYDAVREL